MFPQKLDNFQGPLNGMVMGTYCLSIPYWVSINILSSIMLYFGTFGKIFKVAINKNIIIRLKRSKGQCWCRLCGWKMLWGPHSAMTQWRWQSCYGISRYNRKYCSCAHGTSSACIYMNQRTGWNLTKNMNKSCFKDFINSSFLQLSMGFNVQSKNKETVLQGPSDKPQSL